MSKCFSQLSMDNENYEVKDAKAREEVEKIQRMISTYNINLTNHIIYDFLSSKHSQGMCIDESNNMYVYLNSTNNVTGDLLVFDLNTFTLKTTIPDIQLYHGGDLTVIDGVLYAIGNTNMSIIKYDIETTRRTELNPFSGIVGYNETNGIGKYDDEHIVCMISYNDGSSFANSLEKIKLYKVNINTLAIEEIHVTNTDNLYLNSYCFQSIEYHDNKLYILSSYPNTIIEFTYNKELNTFNYSKIYNIPEFDILGQDIGEVEGISKIKSNSYGVNSFMITTCLIESNVKTLKSYIIDFKSNTQKVLKRLDITGNSFVRVPCVCDSNANQGVYYENGSEAYPFKHLRRAIGFTTNSIIKRGRQIKLYSGNYHVGDINYAECNIVSTNEHSGEIVIDAMTLRNSKFKINGNANVVTRINTRVDLDGGEFYFKNVTFEDVLVVQHCNLYVKDSTFNDVERQSILMGLENAFIKASNCTFANEGVWYYATNGSVIFLNKSVDDSKISRVSEAWIVKSS